MKRTILLVGALLLIIFSIYFLERPKTMQDESGEMVTIGAIEDPGRIEVGTKAPDFILPDYDGNMHQLSDYEGQPIILNFWASWCPFCVEELPLFQSFHEQYKDDGLVMIGVNRQESLAIAQRYSEELNLDFTLLLNDRDDVSAAYQLKAMPSTYFIDGNGIITDIQLGPLTEEELREKIDIMQSEPVEKVKVEKVEEVEEIEERVASLISTREIQVTDGVSHNVPLEDIKGGGPPKDGIPSIDHPKFTSVEEADEFLEDDGLGISVSFQGVDRFYPFQILVWHEIVNDRIGDQAILVSYCPLCGTGIAFDPIVNGKVTEFGTSGKLWNSNLVMYDRQTESYWSQVLGEAIVGEMTGTKLNAIPHQNTTWRAWKNSHPNGQVLSRDTGHSRSYTSSPYGNYDKDESIFFPVDFENDAYHPKAVLWGVELNGEHKAYTKEELDKTEGYFLDEFAGEELEISYDTATLRISIKKTSTNKEIIPFFGFWFSWFAVHPQTEIFTAN